MYQFIPLQTVLNSLQSTQWHRETFKDQWNNIQNENKLFNWKSKIRSQPTEVQCILFHYQCFKTIIIITLTSWGKKNNAKRCKGNQLSRHNQNWLELEKCCASIFWHFNYNINLAYISKTNTTLDLGNIAQKQCWETENLPAGGEGLINIFISLSWVTGAKWSTIRITWSNSISSRYKVQIMKNRAIPKAQSKKTDVSLPPKTFSPKHQK